MIDVEEQLRRYASAVSEPELSSETRPLVQGIEDGVTAAYPISPRRRPASRWTMAAAVVVLLGVATTLVWRIDGSHELVTTTDDPVVTGLAADERLEVRLEARFTGAAPDVQILLTAAVSNLSDEPIPLSDEGWITTRPWPAQRNDQATGPALFMSMLKDWPQPVGFVQLDGDRGSELSTQDTTQPSRRTPERRPSIVGPGETKVWQFASTLSAAHPLGSWQVAFQPTVDADFYSQRPEVWPTPTATVQLALPDDRGHQMTLFAAIDALVSDPAVSTWAEEVLTKRPAHIYFLPEVERGGWRIDVAFTDPEDTTLPGTGQQVGHPAAMPHRLRAMVTPGGARPDVAIIELR